MENRILTLNKEYFGKDQSKRYLKDDFINVLSGFIQREVVISVLDEASKTRHDQEKHEDGKVIYSDFDPNNSALLSGFFQTYQNGFMISVRQLLIKDENGSGGKFIKDITTLDKINSVETSKFNNLIQKAKQFQDKSFFYKIVTSYQAQEFHKDRQPYKYVVRKVTKDFPFIGSTQTIRRRKSGVDPHLLAECLESFAEIVMLYQQLVDDSTSFFYANMSLNDYVEKIYDLFSMEVPDEVKQRTIQNIVKRLPKSINLIGLINKE